jgi:hypothetical protein
MYRLPQAGIIAQELLETHLHKAGYTQSKLMPGYWKHTWSLKEHYQIEEDWGGTRYIGLTVDWDYKRHEVHISVPGYVEKALTCFWSPSPQTSTTQTAQTHNINLWSHHPVCQNGGKVKTPGQR